MKILGNSLLCEGRNGGRAGHAERCRTDDNDNDPFPERRHGLRVVRFIEDDLELMIGSLSFLFGDIRGQESRQLAKRSNAPDIVVLREEGR